MAQPVLPVSAQSEINGLYVTLYDVPATESGFQYWLNVLEAHDPSITSASSSISTADAQFLGQQMTANAPVVNGATYFATLYPTTLNDMQFVQALYQNAAGFTGTGSGDQYWFTQLQALEAGGDSVIQAREAIAGQFVQAFLQNNLSLGAQYWGLSQSDWQALVAGQQALFNKVAVSEYWAFNSNADGGLLNYTAANLSPPSGPFAAGMDLNNSITSNSNSVSTAENAINQAISQDSLGPITNVLPTPVTYTLTTGADNILPGGSTLNGVSAPAATGNDAITGTIGFFGGTLNAGDDIAPGGTNNSLTVIDSSPFSAGVLPAGVTISNIQTLNLTEPGNAGSLGKSFDVSGISGLTTFNATSEGGGTDLYTAAATTNVNATAQNGSVDLFGGLNDTVTAVGGVTVDGAAGTVTATNFGSGDISISGGTNITATQYDGDITISGETGTVQATDTNPGGTVSVDNGTNVSVTAEGDVTVGGTAAPSGSISVTINGPIELENAPLPTVTANGGTSATVNTTGGNVALGTASAPIGGNVVITDTNTGPSTDAFAVMTVGGVTLNTTPTSGNITIGDDATLNASGTGLLNSDNPASGSVVVNNSETFGSTTYYGTSGVNIGTNGATSVSVTGADGVDITDLQTTKATGGANAGDAIGTSTLSSVTLNHVDDTTITSDALSSLSLTGVSADVTIKEVATPSGTPSNPLFLTLSGSSVDLTDVTASSVVVSTSGSTADTLTLDAPKATSVTFENGAALTFNSAGLADLTTINADNTGALSLGNVSGLAALTSINATGSHAAVSVDLGADSTVSFNGVGGGADTVQIESNALGAGGSIAGSTGSTLVANYVAQVGDTALGTNAHISGFSTLALGANAESDAAFGTQTYTSLASTGDVSATVTVGGNSFVVGNTFTVDVNGNSEMYTVAAYNNTTAGENTVAAGLAAAVLTAALPGISVSYNGNNAFTITSATPFTLSDSVSTAQDTVASNGFDQQSKPPSGTAYAETFTGTATGGQISEVIGGDTVTIGTFANETSAQVASALATAAQADAATTGWGAVASGSTVTFTDNTGFAFVDPATFSNGEAGISVSAFAATAGGVAQQDTYDLDPASTPAQGNTITLDINGHTGTFTLGTNDAGNVSQTATDLAAFITANDTSGADFGATASASADSVTITDDALGVLMSDTLPTIGNGGNGTLTIGNVTGPALASYDATGFTALTVGRTAGDVTFTNVAANVGLTITASPGGIVNYELASGNTSGTLPLTVDGVTATVATTGVQNVNITSAGSSANTVTIDDTAAKAITVTGSQALTLTLDSDAAGSLAGISNVTSINASGALGAVNVSGVPLSAAGAIITGGTGLLTAAGSTSASATDVFNVGSGGGNITAGSGGGIIGFNTGTTNIGNILTFGTGTETINLTANNPVGSTVHTLANDVATVNNWNITTSAASDDKLDFPFAKSILANHATSTTGLTRVSADLNYSVSNGIITFSGTTLDPLSNFTLGQLINVTAALEGANQVAAFQYGGNTYVVENGGTAILSGTNVVADDVGVTILSGVTGVQGFGNTAASNTILVGSTIGLQAAPNTVLNSGNGTNAVYNDSGYAIFDDGVQATLGLASTTVNNLAASAQLNLGASETALVVNQVGASGTNSLTVDATADATIGTLTVNGDDYVAINANGHSLTIDSFVDNTGTLPALTITGAGAVIIKGVTGSALTTIDDSAATGSFNLTDTLNSQIIKLGSGTSTLAADGQGDTITQTAGGTLAAGSHAEGNNDTITLGNGGVGTALSPFLANGAGDHITLGTGTDYLTATNNGDVITLGAHADTVTATGTGDTITFSAAATGANTVTIGQGATVNFSATTAGDSETVVLSASSETGATSSGNFNITHMSGVVTGTGDMVDLGALANTNWTAATPAVDVAAAGSLAQALDAVAALKGNNDSVHWFQYGGNTYVEANVTAGGAMGIHDAVIEITGLVNLSDLTASGHVVTL